MIRPMFRRMPALLCLLLAATLLLPTPALADPPDMQFWTQSVDAATVRVYWYDVPTAEGYLVQRDATGMGTGNSLAVCLPEDANEFLDIDLTPGVPYEYRFAALVNGHTYWCGGGTAGVPYMEMAIDPPKDLSYSGHYAKDSGGNLYLDGELSWTPVAGASLYSIEGRSKNAADYLTWAHVDGSVTATPMGFPAVSMNYWIRIRALTYYFFPGEEESVMFYGPFSQELSIQVDPPDSTVWVTVDPGKIIVPAVTIPSLVTPGPTRILRPQTPLTLITPTPAWIDSPFHVLPTPTPVIIR